ncbi:MAG: geranylgeranyl reductase [Thermomicrobiales bacterium]|nr:geranylgeranyl reductase [Thermomicrobiales bacterium]
MAPDVPQFDADVIVVGGGPAGSVSAWLLAERGHRILLLDKARFPRHKACSEYVNPAGARLLGELGLADDLQALGAHRMEAMLIHAPGGRRFLADFGAAQPGSAAIGLSRYRLDSLLLDRARKAGVEAREGAHVRDVVVIDGAVQGVECTVEGVRMTLRAPLTIGADGRHGVVSRALGLDIPLRWPRRTGLVAHYRGVAGLGSWGEMHVAPRRRGYAGLAPLEEDLTNVAFVTSSAAVAERPGSLEAFFEEGLSTIPAMAARLAGAERVGGIRGVGPMIHRTRRVLGDGFALVGDAASFLDPFTGEGVYEALRGATLLAPVADAALRASDLSGRRLATYGAARRRAFWAKRQVCWLVQGFIARPALMDYATARLDRRAATALTLAGVLGDLYPAQQALSPIFLARLLRP